METFVIVLIVVGILIVVVPVVIYVLGMIFDSIGAKEEEERRLIEIKRAEEKRKAELQSILESQEPQPRQIDTSLINCEGQGEALRLNRKYKELIDKYNGYLKAKSRWEWLKSKVDARSELGLDEVEEEKTELDLAYSKKNQLISECKSFDTQAFVPQAELGDKINGARESFLIAVWPITEKSSLRDEVDGIFFKDIPYIETSNLQIFLYPAYCVLKVPMVTSTLKVVGYDELKVRGEESFEYSHSYSYQDEVVKTTYLHQKADGTRDKRYLLSNNPATYEIRRGNIVFTLGEREAHISLRTGSEMERIERATRALIKAFDKDDVRELIKSELVAHEKNCAPKRSTK